MNDITIITLVFFIGIFCGIKIMLILIDIYSTKQKEPNYNGRNGNGYQPIYDLDLTNPPGSK